MPTRSRPARPERRRRATTATRRRPRAPGRAVRAAARESALSVYRDAILKAAADEFADRGYAATRMLDIARRAGMSVGSLYLYFDSKEAIFASMVRASSDRMVEQLNVSVAGVEDPRARIGNLVEAMFRFIEEHRAMFLVWHQQPEVGRAHCQEIAGQADSARERVFALYRATLASCVAVGALRDDVAVEDQLAFVTGAMHGFIEAWVRSNGETGLVDKAPLIIDLTLRALGGVP